MNRNPARIAVIIALAAPALTACSTITTTPTATIGDTTYGPSATPTATLIPNTNTNTNTVHIGDTNLSTLPWHVECDPTAGTLIATTTPDHSISDTHATILAINNSNNTTPEALLIDGNGNSLTLTPPNLTITTTHATITATNPMPITITLTCN